MPSCICLVSSIDNGRSQEDAQINKTRLIQAIEKILNAPKFPNDSTKPTFITVTIFVAMVSILSNALIIHVVRVNSHMRSTTNYYIVNMACGDLLGTFLSSLTSIKHLLTGLRWNSEPYGQATCKLIYYFVSVALLCSIFSLVAITVDRFLAVRRPLLYQHQSSWTKIIIPVVWLLALGIPAKFSLDGFKVHSDVILSNRTYCVALYARSDGIFVTCVGYIIPHVVMVILYTMIAHRLWTRKVPGVNQASDAHHTAHVTAKRVTYMIFFVFLTFNVCWLPMFIAFYNLYFLTNDLIAKFHSNYIPPIVSITAIANGPLNALIFAVFSEHFRLAFKRALKVEKLVALRNRIGNIRFGQRDGSVEPLPPRPVYHDQQASLEMAVTRI